MEQTSTGPLLPRAGKMQRFVTLLVILLPFAGVVTAIVTLWGGAFTWVDLTLLLGMYLATGFGITIGYHRHFAHRSFDTNRPIRFLLGVLGCMSVEGPILKWVAIHRRHHQHSDGPQDPHSPHQFGGGIRGMLSGLWHAHMGWMFTADHPNLADYVKDLRADRLVRVTSNLFPLWVLLGLLIPTVAGGLWTMSWTGAFFGLLWGGLVRIFLVHHVTFSINSVCHLWGPQRFDCHDQSRNNFICGVLGLGEGWHNNHHAFPTSGRHGFAWYEFDLSYIVIRLMTMTGLAWQLRVAGPEAIRAKQFRPVGERRSKSPAIEPPVVEESPLVASVAEDNA
jgi:stearoyl-CoA desaturase (Delta-9 desaturase)